MIEVLSPPAADVEMSGDDREGVKELLPRVIGRAGLAGEAPMLICVAGLHGNEPAGVRALERIFRRLDADPGGLRGLLVGLVGNRKALALGRRYLAHDLNRHWTSERLARIRATDGPLEAEDEELRELDRELDRLLAEASGPVAVLDLHTTSGPGPAWAPLDDTLKNREFGLELPVPLVLGLEEELEGTMSFYLTCRGVRVIGFESGQHEEPGAVDRAEQAIWIALEAAGVLAPGTRPEAVMARRDLTRFESGLPKVVEVRYRHEIERVDGYRTVPGWRSFQPIRRGDVVGRDRRGEVTAPVGGLILMPLYQSQGEDGFFIIRRVAPLWLKISAALRRFDAERFLHWLPGVRRHPELERGFIVDRRWARWLAPEIFHLLGFYRHGPDGRVVVMHRRLDDGV